MYFKILLIFLSLFECAFSKVIADDKMLNPQPCNKTNHGRIKLFRDRQSNDKLLFCTVDNGFYSWKAVDGSQSRGEFFDPAYDCSDILKNNNDAKDGFYWINFGISNKPRKVWCDMTTDGGGYMLIGRKRNASMWSVPSNNKTVTPFGFPHWTSAFGDAPILDFRVQMATKESFSDTKAHWSFRLKAKRPLKHLLVIGQGGCDRRSAGIGNIAFVKDLQTDSIVTTNFQCSKFGLGHHPSSGIGWKRMNSCLQQPCRCGFAFHHKTCSQQDYSGAFSYSVNGHISGIEHDSTASVGCDNGHCCGCYGPVGGTQNYCSDECQAQNGGTITTSVFTWFWMRSTLPKRAWNKCMEYQVVKNNGKLVWYKLAGGSTTPSKGRCSKNGALFYDGIVVVPDGVTAKNVPPVDGLLAYRKDTKELYIRANKAWNVIAQEKKINLKLGQLKKQINYLNKSLGISSQPECTSYSWLTDANRNENASGDGLCDNTLSPGWYRFGGKAGTRMLTTCVPHLRCGTHAPGWVNGNHSTISDGKVTRTVCFSHGRNCCSWSTSIKVLNCGSFYIYKLPRPPNCYLRYCGSDN